MENNNKLNEEASRNAEDAEALFVKAKEDMASDMKSRDIGAVLWDNASAGFHFPPEVSVTDSEGKVQVWPVHGIYRVDETLFLIGPKADVGVEQYYNKDYEERPVVVTLTEDQATRHIGIPSEARGYTGQGTVEEWLSVANCYFEALNLDNDI